MGSSESTRQALRLDFVDQRYVQPYETSQYIADAFDSLKRWRMERPVHEPCEAHPYWRKLPRGCGSKKSSIRYWWHLRVSTACALLQSTNSCVSKQLLNEITTFRGFAKWQTRTDDYASSVTLDLLSFTQPTSPPRSSLGAYIQQPKHHAASQPLKT